MQICAQLVVMAFGERRVQVPSAWYKFEPPAAEHWGLDRAHAGNHKALSRSLLDELSCRVDQQDALNSNGISSAMGRYQQNFGVHELNNATLAPPLARGAVTARSCVPAAAVRVIAHGAVNEGERSTLCPQHCTQARIVT